MKYFNYTIPLLKIGAGLTELNIEFILKSMRGWRNLADALDLGSSGEIRGGSTPPPRIIILKTKY